MKRVVIESPCKAGNGRTFAQNKAYAIECAMDCLRRDESPYAGHLFFTQFLDDSQREDRLLGMTAAAFWNKQAELCAVYMDYDISEGMQAGIQAALDWGIPVEYRELYA